MKQPTKKVAVKTIRPAKTVTTVTTPAKAPSLQSLRDKWGDFPTDPKKRVALREARARELKNKSK